MIAAFLDVNGNQRAGLPLDDQNVLNGWDVFKRVVGICFARKETAAPLSPVAVIKASPARH